MTQLAMQDGALLVCDRSLSSECCEPGGGNKECPQCPAAYTLTALLWMEALPQDCTNLCPEPQEITATLLPIPSVANTACTWSNGKPGATACDGFTCQNPLVFLLAGFLGGPPTQAHITAQFGGLTCLGNPSKTFTGGVQVGAVDFCPLDVEPPGLEHEAIVPVSFCEGGNVGSGFIHFNIISLQAL